jgi:hypothetical protein
MPGQSMPHGVQQKPLEEKKDGGNASFGNFKIDVNA